jgi:hypothetical protein
MQLTSVYDVDPKLIAEAIKTRSPYRPLVLDIIPQERWPCTVSYDGRGIAYVPHDAFRLPPDQRGPSDCVWIVPSTTP